MTATEGSNPGFGDGGTHQRTYGSFVRQLSLYALDRGEYVIYLIAGKDLRHASLEDLARTVGDAES